MNRSVDLPGPKYCVWELTLACNMRCLHCGSYAGGTRGEEMSLEQLLDVADQLAEAGVRRLTLSGGEPLLRKGWEQIAERLIRKGVHVGMISNGYYMSENVPKLAELKKLDGPGSLEIVAMSVDGLRDTHDSFRRVPGSFDRIAEAFGRLKAAGIKTAAITSVSTLNLPQLEEMYKALLEWRVDAWQLQTLFGGGRMREHPELMPGPAGVERTAEFIASKRRLKGPMLVFPADCVGYFSELEYEIRPNGWDGCQAGLISVGIEANGNVKGCLSLFPEARDSNPFVEGNLRENTFKEIWNKPGAFAYNREFRPSRAEGFCRSCLHLNRCRCGCSAQAYFASGSVYNNPFCILAHRASGRQNR